MAKMRLGVLGTGDVGRALGSAFVELGYEVKLGAREAGNEKATAWAAQHPERASHGTFADAASFGDAVVIATQFAGTENALRLAGEKNFEGKVTIDVTNPLAFKPGRPPGLALGHTDSGGEQIQRWLPTARVVKAFNTMGNPHMFRPSFPEGPPTHFICGNDAAAKATVTDILREFGWEDVVDIGDMEGARELEPLCILWVKYAIAKGSGNHAFRLLRK
jgi:predicted dinucleotide-binding enzyme